MVRPAMSAATRVGVGKIEIRRRPSSLRLERLEAVRIFSRRSRGAILERFRAARGSLLDVFTAEEVCLEGATACIEAFTELDVERRVLLFRSGLLHDRPGVPSEQDGVRG